MRPPFVSRSGELRSRAQRRAHPIHVYVGHNGTGKSLTAVWDTLPTLEAGRPVLSTVRLLDYERPRECEGWEWGGPLDDQRIDCQDLMHGTAGHRQAHPLYVRFTAWPQLLHWTWGDVLMDEVTGVADSQDWAAVPSAIVNKFPQLRRDECALRITTLSFANCNKRIRQAALAVTRCVGTLPAPRSSEFGKGRVYRPRRLVAQTTYDSKTLPQDDPTNGAYEKAKMVSRGRLWVPLCPAINAYDTYAPVDMVGTVTDSGRCAYCGGNRRAPECSCVDYVADREARRGAVRRPLAAEHGPRLAHGRHLAESEQS